MEFRHFEEVTHSYIFKVHGLIDGYWNRWVDVDGLRRIERSL